MCVLANPGIERGGFYRFLSCQKTCILPNFKNISYLPQLHLEKVINTLCSITDGNLLLKGLAEGQYSFFFFSIYPPLLKITNTPDSVWPNVNG